MNIDYNNIMIIKFVNIEKHTSLMPASQLSTKSRTFNGIISSKETLFV